MIALVCDTPYQMVSAVFLANHLFREQKLVFFLNQLWDRTSRQFDIRARDDRVYKILYYGREQMKTHMLLLGLADPLGMLRRLEGYGEDMVFDAVIASRTTWMATYLYNYCIRRNPDIKMYLIEEGAGEYTGPMCDTRFTRACRMLRRKTHCDHIDAAYFSAPALYTHQTNFPVYRLPGPDAESIRLLGRIFDADSEMGKITPYTYILLDEAFHIDESRFSCSQDSVIRWTEETLDPGEVVVKMHPRTDALNAGGIAAVYSKAPFELLPAHADMNRRVLVSAISTAMLTPKLLYGQEPYLVFTYHLLKETLASVLSEEAVKNVTALIEGVRGMYANRNKTFAPRTQEEYKAVLRTIDTELKGESR